MEPNQPIIKRSEGLIWALRNAQPVPVITDKIIAPVIGDVLPLVSAISLPEVAVNTTTKTFNKECLIWGLTGLWLGGVIVYIYFDYQKVKAAASEDKKVNP